MFSVNLFYNSEIILQKVKRNRWFLHLRVIVKKLNNSYFKINNSPTYFKIGDCTREPYIFLKLFKNKSLVVCQTQNVIFVTL